MNTSTSNVSASDQASASEPSRELREVRRQLLAFIARSNGVRIDPKPTTKEPRLIS